MYRYLPGLFKWGYRYSEDHPSLFEDRSAVHQFLVSGIGELGQYISEGGYDTVICTHILSAIMLTHLQEQSPLSIGTAFVATDYTCYPGVGACRLEHVFVPDCTYVEAYSNTGIPWFKIVATGIPVHPEFFRRTEKHLAKGQLNIKETSVHLLMMGGSMGCGPMEEVVHHVARKLPEWAEVTIMCGTNKRLYRTLDRRYRLYGNIHIIGYSDAVSLYMDAADLYVTKPGGISVTEAATKNLPMVFVNAVAGCEQYNMEFFLKMGGAVTADTPYELAATSIDLLCSPVKRRSMENRLRKWSRLDGAENIYRELQQAEPMVRVEAGREGLGEC